MNLPHFRKLPCADERNGNPPFTDCGPAGAVNIARAADNGGTPATDAEVIAIRRLIGQTPGGRTTLQMVQAAILRKYGYATRLGDGTWTPIYEGLTTNRWLIVRGNYKALPDRMQNVGQPDVEHFIVVGPGPVIVDPIRKPAPFYAPATLSEIQHFCATGEYDSLSIAEYSHLPPVAQHRVLIAPKAVVRQAVFKGACIAGWDDRVWGRTSSTAPCSAPVVRDVCAGGSATVVYVTKGTFKGRWIHLGSGVSLVQEN